MRRTRPLLVVLLALLVAVAGVVVLRDPQGVAGTPVAGQSAATTPPATAAVTTTSVPSSTTTTAAATRTGAPLAGKIKPGEPRQGVATFYDSDGGGACSYDPGPDRRDRGHQGPRQADRAADRARRETGALRYTPVMRVEHGGSHTVVASKGGAPEHPTWYHNSNTQTWD